LLINVVIVNAQANKKASKPAVAPKTKQADAKKENSTPQKKDTKAKSQALTDAACKNEMVLYLSSDEDPSLSKTSDVSNGICLGTQNKLSCCNKIDYAKIEDQWYKEVNSPDFPVTTYVHAVKDLT